MWDRRAQRARILAERYPASREILRFYAGLADWQGEVARELTSPAGSGQGERLQNLRNAYPSLLDLVARTGPPALSESARELNTTQLDQLIHESWESPGNFSALEFFARAVLQPYAASFPAGLDCPWCPQPPQAGCLRPQADGLAFDLVCGESLSRSSRHSGSGRTGRSPIRSLGSRARLLQIAAQPGRDLGVTMGNAFSLVFLYNLGKTSRHRWPTTPAVPSRRSAHLLDLGSRRI